MLDRAELAVVAGSTMFRGVDSADLGPLLEAVHATTRSLAAGESFRRAGDELAAYPLVLSGRVRAVMNRGGRERIMGEFGPGSSFAEAVPSSLRRMPVDVRAPVVARLLLVPSAGLLRCAAPGAEAVRANIASQVAERVGELGSAVGVLAEPRLADRIVAYLETLPREEDGSVTVPFGRAEWASVLCVADKSLIRELGALQDAGRLRVDGRRITVL